jgi:tetratricopeptide (TPR) repeat protein
MMMPSPYLILSLLVTGCFTLGTILQTRTLKWNSRSQSDSVLKALLGDGRQLFANHFFVQADVSFHSGYYPSIFDRRETAKSSPMAGGQGEDDGHAGHGEEAHKREMDFMGQPRDWIERFGRRFRITEHTHLQGGQEREILPWLRLSAELDPQRVTTYTVAAYWLRTKLGKVKEAEAFLRDGLRANPDSYEILFELGQLCSENYRDTARARNLWELALSKWQKQEPQKEEPNLFALDQIAVNLGRLEEEEGNLERAISHFELAKKASPRPEVLQKQIDELKQKLSTRPTSPTLPRETIPPAT